MSRPSQVLRVAHREGAESDLLSPTVGIFTPSVAAGELVSAGQVIGTIEVLGVETDLRVPDDVAGRVTARAGGGYARVPVQYGEALVGVALGAAAEVPHAASAPIAGAKADLFFPAPMSGRFYSRPSPTEAPFVCSGDVVSQGQTIGLLEVMKTFNRLVYQGDALPEEAVVERIVPADGDDVVRGDVILVFRGPAEK